MSIKKWIPWIILLLLLIGVLSIAAYVYVNRKTFDNYEEMKSGNKNVGLYVEELGEFYSLEERPQIIEWFEYWLGEESQEKLAVCGIKHDAFPLITWMPNNIEFEDIVAGKYDKYVTDYLKRKAETCEDMDVLIRFAHEMELRPNYRFKWYSWQSAGPELFIKAWRHMVELSRKVSSNIKWVWSPNRCDQYSLPYYPGDEWVDYVGITMDLELTHHTRYKKFQDFYELEGQRESLLSLKKEVIICEAGYAESGDTDEKAAYLESIYDGLESNPELIAVVFFNVNVDENRLYRFTHNDKYLQVFYDGIRRLRKNGLLHQFS